MEGCLACDLAEGRVDLPGGEILVTDHWIVEHTVGPLSLGTLIVKPQRHVVHVWELGEAEAGEIGGPLVPCRWRSGAHPFRRPAGHAHLDDSIDDYGPHLQVAMFDAGATPPKGEVERFAERARAALGT